MAEELASQILDYLLVVKQAELKSNERWYHNTRFKKCKECEGLKMEIRALKYIRDKSKTYWKYRINSERYYDDDESIQKGGIVK